MWEGGEGSSGTSENGEEENMRSQVREHHQNLLEGETEFQYPRGRSTHLDPDTWGSPGFSFFLVLWAHSHF